MQQSMEMLEKNHEFKFTGRLDTAKCAQIEPDLRALLARVEGPVVFDLDGVEFVSSAFLRLCIYAHRNAGDHGFEIINAAPPIKKVFKIAGLDTMLKIV
jgi:anti-anti-sigma factor